MRNPVVFILVIISLISCKIEQDVSGFYRGKHEGKDYILQVRIDSTFSLKRESFDYGFNECQGIVRKMGNEYLKLTCVEEWSPSPIASNYLIDRDWIVTKITINKLRLEDVILKRVPQPSPSPSHSRSGRPE